MKILKLFLIMLLICGVAYPLAMTAFSKLTFPHQSEGSLIRHGGKIVGSELLAQKFTETGYFHPRPSAADYATVASGASQTSPTHKAGMELLRKRKHENPEAAMDAWTASGSGLDPHISPASALAQVTRVAVARGIHPEYLKSLIEQHTEGMQFGIWGQPRVNVLMLNLSLMELKDANAR